MFRRTLLVSGLLAALVGLVGCGGPKVEKTYVTGSVTYQGKPLPTGTIAFVNENTVATGQITNGTYTVPEVAVGPNKISILTPAPMGMQTMQKVEGKSFAGAAGEVVQVPATLNNPDTSGLTATIGTGTEQAPFKHDVAIP